MARSYRPIPIAIAAGVAIGLAIGEPRAIPLIVCALVAIGIILISGRGMGPPTGGGAA